jgi:hypothetical protein
MKYMIGLMVALPMLAIAHTITYDNGEIYTVADDEYIFVSKQPNLWSYHPYSKSVQFKKQWPTEKVDQPEPTPNPNPVGGHEWCKTHVPFEYGFSFSDQLWVRACDKNNDGSYGCGDEQFDASDDAAVCPAG